MHSSDSIMVMENGHSSPGLEDGTIDVEDLLVEPQDGNLSMASVICFDKKIPKNAVDREDGSCSSGGSDTGIARKGKDILNGEAHDAMASEAEIGYFRMESDFCSMGEEYLIGVEFAESITNLDYGSRGGLPISASDCQNQVSTDGSDTGCRSDLSRTSADGENPTISPRSCTLQNSCKSRDSSTSSSLDVLSEENDGRFTLAGEKLFSPKTKSIGDIELTCENGSTNVIEEAATLARSVQESCTNGLPTQKRSRKRTQRYIDEIVDPILTHSKKRQEVSSSTIGKKSLGVKERRKCHVGPKAVIEAPPEESSVIAIQVPFGSLANKECEESLACDTRDPQIKKFLYLKDGLDCTNNRTKKNQVERVDCKSSMPKSNGKYVALNNLSTMGKCVTAVDLKKRRCLTESASNKKEVASQKKRNDCTTIAVIRKKRNHNRLTPESQNKKRDASSSAETESAEEGNGKRKHHRLWTISEVRKLIEGISQYGVGRWSRIKKLFFSTSAHRTSVDLKDKWRNLLKASGMMDQGGKKRNQAWRPLPNSILRRVCELATEHPYPKGEGEKKKMGRSSDITLSNYRKILRSVDGK